MPNTKSIGIAYSDQAITSGSVDATPIGATTASTGAFTSVTNTGTDTARSGTAITAGGQSAFLATSTAGFGIYLGSGAPTVSAAKGSLYLRSDGSSSSTRIYVNSDGATTWVNITTAS
jgi:hypothetical protein